MPRPLTSVVSPRSAKEVHLDTARELRTLLRQLTKLIIDQDTHMFPLDQLRVTVI